MVTIHVSILLGIKIWRIRIEARLRTPTRERKRKKTRKTFLGQWQLMVGCLASFLCLVKEGLSAWPWVKYTASSLAKLVLILSLARLFSMPGRLLADYGSKEGLHSENHISALFISCWKKQKERKKEKNLTGKVPTDICGQYWFKYLDFRLDF